MSSSNGSGLSVRERVAHALGGWSVDHAWFVVLISLVATVAAGWAAYHLDIVTDLKRLLPDDFPSVERLDDLQERAGNQSDIVITVKSNDPDANIRYGRRLAELMEKESSIRYVRFHRDLSTLEKKALLYLSVDKLEEIRTDVIERIKKQVRSTLEIGLDDDDDDDDGTATPPPAPSGDPGVVERALDDFEDDEDFGGDGAGDVEEPAGAAGGPAAAELDDFEEDEDFASGGNAGTGEGDGSSGGAGDEDEPLDIDELKKRYGVADVAEYYTNDDGTMLVVRALPHAGTSDTSDCRDLVEMTRRHIDGARAADDPADLGVTIEGHHLDRTEEVKSMKGNMVTSALACLGLLLVVVGIYFRRLRAIPLILAPLIMSVVCALGLAWVFYGYLNIISAFIFAILLGLGIDFGIHVLARYDEARREGLSNREATLVSLATSGLSAATGAFTTAAVFFILTVGKFQGFSQFGLVAGCGVVISLLVVFTTMPALITLFEKARPWRSEKKAAPVAAADDGPRRGWIPPLRGGAATVAAFLGFCLSLGGAALAAVHLGDIEFEYSFKNLGSRTKLAAEAEKERKEAAAHARGEEQEEEEDSRSVIGEHAMGAPTIVMADDVAQAEAVYRHFEAIENLPNTVRMALLAATTPEELRAPQLVSMIANLPPDDAERQAVEQGLADVERLLKVYPLTRVQHMVDRLYEAISIFRFVPADQEQKRPIIQDIRRRLLQKREIFEGDEREQLDEFLTYTDPGALAVADLPEWIRVRFREPSGHEGRFLVLRTKGSKSNIQNTRILKDAYFTLLTESGAEVPAAATYFVLPEIMETIENEGPLIIGLALAGLFVILFLFFRRPGAVMVVLIPLVFSLLWVCGVIAVAGFKLNFYNVVVVPLLLGMGIDHGVHIYSRFREQGRQGLALVLSETGTAIGMATLTTMIGFGGLFFADSVGVNSMATLAILGMGLAFVGAVVTLPALLHLGRARQKR